MALGSSEGQEGWVVRGGGKVTKARDLKKGVARVGLEKAITKYYFLPLLH